MAHRTAATRPEPQRVDLRQALLGHQLSVAIGSFAAVQSRRRQTNRVPRLEWRTATRCRLRSGRAASRPAKCRHAGARSLSCSTVLRKQHQQRQDEGQLELVHGSPMVPRLDEGGRRCIAACTGHSSASWPPSPLQWHRTHGAPGTSLFPFAPRAHNRSTCGGRWIAFMHGHRLLRTDFRLSFSTTSSKETPL